MIDKVQLIRSEIERELSAHDKVDHLEAFEVGKAWNRGHRKALETILSFIDSLPQEPITNKMEGFLEGLTAAKNNYQEGYMDGYSAAEKEIYKDLNDKMEKYHASQVDYGIHIEKPQEPSEDLEEEISRTYHNGSITDTDDMDHVSYENIARHFAKWGAEHLKK